MIDNNYNTRTLHELPTSSSLNIKLQTSGCLQRTWMDNKKKAVIYFRYKTPDEKEYLSKILKFMKVLFGKDAVKASRNTTHKLCNSRFKDGMTNSKLQVINDTLAALSSYNNGDIGDRGSGHWIKDSMYYKYKPEITNKDIILSYGANKRTISLDGSHYSGSSDYINITEFGIKNFKRYEFTGRSGREVTFMIQFFRYITMNAGNLNHANDAKPLRALILKTLDEDGYNYKSLQKIMTSKKYQHIHGYWKTGNAHDVGVKVLMPTTIKYMRDALEYSSLSYRSSNNYDELHFKGIPIKLKKMEIFGYREIYNYNGFEQYKRHEKYSNPTKIIKNTEVLTIKDI